MRRERLYNILQGAHISEKANMIADKKNCFTFKVLKDASVCEIKEAVDLALSTRARPRRP